MGIMSSNPLVFGPSIGNFGGMISCKNFFFRMTTFGGCGPPIDLDPLQFLYRIDGKNTIESKKLLYLVTRLLQNTNFEFSNGTCSLLSIFFAQSEASDAL